MALIIEANFITQIDAAAAALTTAMNDDTLSGIALEIQHPYHPLRKIEKLFNFDPVTGIWTTDTDYIGEAYKDNIPMKGTRDQQTITEPPV